MSDWSGMLEKLSPQSKGGLKLLTSLAVLLIVSVFVYAFVPRLGSTLEAMWTGGLTIVAIATVVVVSILIHSCDALYYGNAETNKFAKAFQAKWPSRHLAERLDICEGEARIKWFQQFNKWAQPSHPMHEQWKMTFNRGFSCRLVYALLWLLPKVFFLSGLLLAAEGVSYAAFHHQLRGTDLLWLRALVCGGAGAMWLLIRTINSPDTSHPTGVWRRFNEIEDMNIAWMDDNLGKFSGDTGDKQGDCD